MSTTAKEPKIEPRPKPALRPELKELLDRGWDGIVDTLRWLKNK